MKVGILTFYDAHNYGAVLQAYVLKKYIKQLGYDAKIITYHHKDIPDGFPKEPNAERWEKFDKFINELVDNEKNVYTTEEELEQLDIDVWICGSDQIWNTKITRGFNRGYFLDFNTNGKKISYAVSMGLKELPKEYEEKFKNSLEQIDEISVREEALEKYAKKFVDKEIIRTLDPTLLLEENGYEEFISDNKYGDYVLVYPVGHDERLKPVATKIAEEKNTKIIELNDRKMENYYCDQISSAGPEEFLTLIKHAKAVVCNSFHGTVFSILFKKDFYTIAKENNSSRMETLLKIVDMEDRLITKVEDIEKVKELEFEKAYEKLNVEREKSIKFLKNALN